MSVHALSLLDNTSSASCRARRILIPLVVDGFVLKMRAEKGVTVGTVIITIGSWSADFAVKKSSPRRSRGTDNDSQPSALDVTMSRTQNGPVSTTA